ncbi:MAG: alanine dehydrogenase [Paludibacteraceae bacterium]|nr:alanine dehydrogenase [Paludibacteraceae bacterium]MBP5136199.1 alanine dehydrogenase [Paludibacteraceae bacterium]MBP5743140.1 alanine dehydrogenase [Paludibacteraceae bacterium]
MAFEGWHNEAFMPEDCLLREIHSSKGIVMGIPKEDVQNETRLALTPEAVGILVERGHTVLVETGAGDGMSYSDIRFAENGATIVNSAAEVYAADMVLKIAPPTFEEVEMMRKNTAVFSMLQLTRLEARAVKEMARKKIVAVAYDLLRDYQKTYPIAGAIHEIEGMTAISVASQYMSYDHGGKGLLLGGVAGISATEVIILGADIAGAAAARTAQALGAQVKVFDHDVSKLRRLQQQLGQNLFTSVLHPQVLRKAFKSADAVIGTLRYIEGGERFMVSQDTISTMKKGSVIIDLSTDLGGCFETTECRSLNSPIYVRDGVIHFCVPNLSSRVGRTSSMAISNIFAPMLIRISNYGGMRQAIANESGIRNGVYTFNGYVVNDLIAKHLNIDNSIGGTGLKGL